MPRLALLLEYDGAAYGGSQRQANAPSIQQALEEAIERFTRCPVRTEFAGRTDSGVHAFGQVAAFDTTVQRPLASWRAGLNALLPQDIAIRSVAEAPAEFDPRRHARRRVYQYQIWNWPVRSPILARWSWHVEQHLDTDPMMRAAGLLEGEHDFASFGGAPGPGRSTRRKVFRAELGGGDKQVIFDIEGTAFLPHQVRRTVGALVEIGRGRLSPEMFEQWLARPEQGVAGPAAPPHGLCLMQVSYEGLLLFGEDD
jgi:tRNA pseudouridine38-40 synthase